MAKNQQAGLRQSMKASREDSLTGDGVFSLATLDLRFARQKTLDPRVTHTRASSGTYVGSDGVLRSAVTNLLLRSEEFDNAAWTPGSIPAAVTANNAIAPNGTLTADLITGVSAAADQLQQVVTVLNSTVYTYSIYIKQNTTLLTRIGLFNATASTWMGAVDIAWAAGVPSTSSTIGSPSNISYVAVGDGWYRCSFTTTTTTASTQIHFHPDRNNTQASAWIWGAQLEQSSTVGEYVPTTSTINSAPRFDHNPTTGESLGLLGEEARTNLLVRSEEFDNASWTQNGATVTPNASQSPAEGTTADLVAVSSSGGSKSILCNIASLTVASNYTLSFYAKAGASSTVAAGLLSTTFLGLYNFTLTGAGSVSAAVAGVSAAITLVGNGWYRCQLTVTTTSVGATLLIYPNSTSNSIGDSIYLWGAQLEAGTFPTSYIPTTTATVTRAADVASITGSNFSSWYRQDEGTMFARASSPVASSIFAVDDGSAGNRIISSFLNTTTSPRLRVVTGGSDQANFSPGSITAGAVFSQASVYKTNDFATALDGGTAAVDTSGIVPTGMTTARIGANVAGITIINGHIRRLTYWPTRLGNEVLQRITQ